MNQCRKERRKFKIHFGKVRGSVIKKKVYFILNITFIVLVHTFHDYFCLCTLGARDMNVFSTHHNDIQTRCEGRGGGKGVLCSA